MIKNPKSKLESGIVDRSIFNLSRSENRLWYFEPEVINQAIDYSMGLPTHSGSNGNCPRDNYFNVIQNVATKYTPQQVCKTIREALVKKAPNSFSMVQARKETPDHVSVQEECLNSSCPKEFSLVGIKRAILKIKNFGRGICKPIFLITR